ncbi:hypothetical protein [Aquimarina sp. RZ0]|uniref:hypothetical protein n=1 Tax=Aquimarina sp. RZ0 TaxID=2607730 RepID=UPI0011F2BF3E|nr:hypothetical protein [Aquimarina sp. RZ0]KAA1247935.1 hypothetical protein F0000_01565 [Aquimarina sp. RZ0]
MIVPLLLCLDQLKMIAGEMAVYGYSNSCKWLLHSKNQNREYMTKKASQLSKNASNDEIYIIEKRNQ